MVAGNTLGKNSVKNILMSDLPSSRSRWSDNQTQQFEVVQHQQEIPDFLKDVPSDFPILGKPGTEFESAVVSSKHKKHQEKTSIHLP